MNVVKSQSNKLQSCIAEWIPKAWYCVISYYVTGITLTPIFSLFCQCFISFFFPLIKRSSFLHHFCSYSFYLLLSAYFFYVTFAIVLYPFWESSTCLHKCYRFKIYLSVIWKTPFSVLPLFTKLAPPWERFCQRHKRLAFWKIPNAERKTYQTSVCLQQFFDQINPTQTLAFFWPN